MIHMALLAANCSDKVKFLITALLNSSRSVETFLEIINREILSLQMGLCHGCCQLAILCFNVFMWCKCMCARTTHFMNTNEIRFQLSISDTEACYDREWKPLDFCVIRATQQPLTNIWLQRFSSTQLQEDSSSNTLEEWFISNSEFPS